MLRKAKNKRIIVAMSGGVDSSVAAALLKRAGFDAIGIFMKFWIPDYSGAKRENRCCTPDSEKRARLVAKKIGIPFYVFNFEKEFKKKVVDYFLKEQKAGNTPNPCVVCNKEIKFGLLLEKARKLGADYVATGHYARLRREIPNPKSQIPNKSQTPIFKLLKAKDKSKDQSYFLWELDQRMLKHILFPVGGFTKEQVLGMAKRFKLPVLNIPESQEICFVPGAINDFLGRYIKPKPGKIIDFEGRTVGVHQGLHFYTIGQRKGIELSGGPYYVASKDLKKNALIVTKNDKNLLKKELFAKEINWLSGREPELPLKIKAKIRYRQKGAQATIKKSEKGYKIVFSRPQRAITSGQSVVFYKGQELLGGGVI